MGLIIHKLQNLSYKRWFSLFKHLGHRKLYIQYSSPISQPMLFDDLLNLDIGTFNSCPRFARGCLLPWTGRKCPYLWCRKFQAGAIHPRSLNKTVSLPMRLSDCLWISAPVLNNLKYPLAWWRCDWQKNYSCQNMMWSITCFWCYFMNSNPLSHDTIYIPKMFVVILP